MKLHSPHIEGPVAKGHDVAFVAGGGHFQTVGQVFPVDYPRVISAYGKALGKSFKKIIGDGNRDRTLDAVEHGVQVAELCSVDFTDGLFAQADTQNRFLARICTDDIEQQTGFFRNAGTRREQNLVECFEFLHTELVVTQDSDFGPQFFDQMAQVVDE